MTTAAGKYWTPESQAYRQARVVQPPSLQNGNNARHAIWHFGRTLTLHVYPGTQHKWRASDGDAVDDGRHERGDPFVVQIRGVWQPNTQKRGRGVIDAVEASRTENNFILHVDSHDPVNIKAIEETPGASSIFPTGLRLCDFDDPSAAAGVNFPMAIVFRGAAWKIKQPIALWQGGDEELSEEGAIYRAECQLWSDNHHERDARGASPVWGPRT